MSSPTPPGSVDHPAEQTLDALPEALPTTVGASSAVREHAAAVTETDARHGLQSDRLGRGREGGSNTGGRRTVFRGKIIDVAVEQVRLPTGRDVELEVIRHPGGAAAVAIDDRRRVCLLRQYRHVAGGWLWELPAGKLDPGEGPAVTAERELAEEAGLVAASWDSLGRLNSSPGVFAEIIHLYLARGLSEVDLGHEGDEVIEVHWISLDQALDWCLDGTITDAKTLIGLYRAAATLRQAGESQPVTPAAATVA
jgi:ADP-ribose pyrophosphatase